MPDKIIRPERRRLERRHDRLTALGVAVDEAASAERRTHCWDLSPICDEERRKRCAAHFVKRNCWDLWGAEYFPPGRKPCCHNDQDCSECPVASAKFRGPVSIYVEVPARTGGERTGIANGGRPAGYCAELYSVKDSAVARNESEAKSTFKCHRRRGVVLHSSYVTEVCGTVHHRQCPFFSDD